MNEITLTQNTLEDGAVQTVRASDLHAALEVRKDFSDWTKAQISRARLVEGRDFIKLPQKGELSPTAQNLRSPKKGSAMAREQTTIEYHFTVDTAKHVAMMSNTEKGFEARESIIKQEREARKQERLQPFLTTPIYRELRYHAAVAERRSVRWVIEHKMTAWVQHKFRLISPKVIDPIISAVKTFLTAYWPDEEGNMRFLSKDKPAQSLIERGWTDKEIASYYRMSYKHDPNPPETLEQLMVRMGDRPKAHLLGAPV